MINLLIAQSGGPTAAINASLAGAIQTAFQSGRVSRVYGALHGIQGVMDSRLIDLSCVADQESLDRLKRSPAMALGSCRVCLPVPEQNGAPYEHIERTLKQWDIGGFVYIGGNDSMDTAHKLSQYLARQNVPCRVVGIPKTIDNDMQHTDHTPGFGSAAKYIAHTLVQIRADALIYDVPSVTIVELMGRNAGWLAACAALPQAFGQAGADLLYLPEVPFDDARFVEDILACQRRTQPSVVVAVSEGIRAANGHYVAQAMQSGETDAFGHRYLTGAGMYLENLVRRELQCKVRSVTLSVLQRCAAHCLSAVDIEESTALGAAAVEAVLAGHTGVLPLIHRESTVPYRTSIRLHDLADVANSERPVPRAWINERGNGVSHEMLDYLKPLIQGSLPPIDNHGFPNYISLCGKPIQYNHTGIHDTDNYIGGDKTGKHSV